MSIQFDIKFKGPEGRDLLGDIGPDAELKEFLEYLRLNQIRIAREAFAEEQAKGNLKGAFTIVDNRKDAAVETVKPLGKIQFVKPFSDITFLAEIYNAILERSPVDTGLYKSQHVVYFNNQAVANTLNSLLRWIGAKNGKGDIKAGDQIRMVNLVPYARKIERYGLSVGGSIRIRKSRDKLRYKGRKFKVNLLAENGPYYLTARYTARKFGRNVAARFELISGSQLKNLPKFPKKSGKGNMSQDFANGSGPYVYPSIKIVFTAEGIKVGGGNA